MCRRAGWSEPGGGFNGILIDRNSALREMEAHVNTVLDPIAILVVNRLRCSSGVYAPPSDMV